MYSILMWTKMWQGANDTSNRHTSRQYLSLFLSLCCHLSPLFYLSNNMQCNAENLSLAFFHIAFSTVLELDQWLLFCCNHFTLIRYVNIFQISAQCVLRFSCIIGKCEDLHYIEKITLHCLLISYKFCTHS